LAIRHGKQATNISMLPGLHELLGFDRIWQTLSAELKMLPMPSVSSREPKVSREGSSGFLKEHVSTTVGAGLDCVNAIASLPQGVRQLKRDARLKQ
jgi:hypothetical protein